MNFKIGDKVTVIDEDLSGTVVSVKDAWVVFKCNDGFDYTYPITSLYSINEDHELNFSKSSKLILQSLSYVD